MEQRTKCITDSNSDPWILLASECLQHNVQCFFFCKNLYQPKYLLLESSRTIFLPSVLITKNHSFAFSSRGENGSTFNFSRYDHCEGLESIFCFLRSFFRRHFNQQKKKNSNSYCSSVIYCGSASDFFAKYL